MCFSVEVEKDLRKCAEKFNAQVSVTDVEKILKFQTLAEDRDWTKKTLNLPRKPVANFIKLPGEDGRIYPGSFTYVLTAEKSHRVFLPMRYRVRPQSSKTEIPTKFNVFNAHLDSLENRQTWKPLFMRNHGILPFKRFFEWVEEDGKKRLISFRPEQFDLMWAPCLWDYWENQAENVGFFSFAIITDEPPPEIRAKGHDRCPVFLKEELISDWLSPERKSRGEIFDILKNKQETFYLHDWV